MLQRSKKKQTDDGPNPIDVHVGERIRTQRMAIKMSQDALAEKIGVTFQQVQKYERGANRVSASKLYQICQVLGVPVAYVFEGLDGQGEPVNPLPPMSAADLNMWLNLAKMREPEKKALRALIQSIVETWPLRENADDNGL